MNHISLSNLKEIPRRRWLLDFLPLLFWMALIFALSNRPTLVDIGDPVGEKLFFKGAHMIVYGVLMWLWWRALSPQRETDWPVLALALGLTVLYGISDEIHQRFVPGRHGRLADVLFDTAGALTLLLLLRRSAWLRGLPELLLPKFSPPVR